MKEKTNDNIASNDFFKTRSYSGCISAALGLLCTNFATIFRKTWLYATIMAVIGGAFAFISFPSLTATEGAVNAWPYIIVLAEMMVLTICITVANSRTKAGFLSLINGLSVKKNFLKHLKVSFIMLGITIIFALTALMLSIGIARYMFTHNMPSETADNVITGVFIAFFVINICAYLPFAYSVTRHLLSDSKTKEIFGRNYHVGLKRFGFLFVIGTIILLVLMIVSAFMALPALITTVAAKIDGFGVENGDPSGLPSYFPWLSFLTNTVVCFILTYIIFWTDLTFCYAYGTIEADRSETLEQKAQNDEQHIQRA